VYLHGMSNAEWKPGSKICVATALFLTEIGKQARKDCMQVLFVARTVIIVWACICDRVGSSGDAGYGSAANPVGYTNKG